MTKKKGSTMTVFLHKCLNCSAGLSFDPTTQKLSCGYCGSSFTEEELVQAGQTFDPKAEETAKTDETNEELALYSCGNCGAEVATSETTAATFCYYCHNPVVLSGRLAGDFFPEQVIPFVINKEKVIKSFFEWIDGKWFVPKNFFSPIQIEKIQGIYFPYWLANYELKVILEGQAIQEDSWKSGDILYTKKRYFNIRRQGKVAFHELVRNALKKANRHLVEGVQPFDFSKAEKFSTTFLSGFQAEKRDCEIVEFQPELREEVQGYACSLIRNTTENYTSVDVSEIKTDFLAERAKYVLLPVWVLTYKGEKGRIYHYAMNGQTGKFCGDLPVDSGRLRILFGLVAISLYLILLIGGYWL